MLESPEIGRSVLGAGALPGCREGISRAIVATILGDNLADSRQRALRWVTFRVTSGRRGSKTDAKARNWPKESEAAKLLAPYELSETSRYSLGFLETHAKTPTLSAISCVFAKMLSNFAIREPKSGLGDIFGCHCDQRPSISRRESASALAAICAGCDFRRRSRRVIWHRRQRAPGRC